jgi:hypothetical protein
MSYFRAAAMDLQQQLACATAHVVVTNYGIGFYRFLPEIRFAGDRYNRTPLVGVV